MLPLIMLIICIILTTIITIILFLIYCVSRGADLSIISLFIFITVIIAVIVLLLLSFVLLIKSKSYEGLLYMVFFLIKFLKVCSLFWLKLTAETSILLTSVSIAISGYHYCFLIDLFISDDCGRQLF